MKKIWEMTAAGAMLLSALLPLSALELVKDGKTDYVVVIGENGRGVPPGEIGFEGGSRRSQTHFHRGLP